MRASLALTLATTVASVARPASAQSGCANAAREVSAGIELRERGLHQAALDVFVALSQRCPSPRVTVQIGLAEASLGRWAEAHEHIVAARVTTDDAWINSRRRAIDEALREVRSHLAEVNLTVSPEGASVTLDGARVASFPLWTTAGRHRIESSAPSYETWAREVELRAGERFTSTLTLTPRTSGATTETPPTNGGRAIEVPPRPSNAMRYAGYGLLGAGVALGVAAGVQWILSNGQLSSSTGATPESPGEFGAWARYNNLRNFGRALSPEAVCEQAERDTIEDAAAVRDLCASSRTTSVTAIVFGASGAVLVGAGAVLWLLSPSARRASLRVAPVIAAGARGASLSVSF